MYSNDKGYIQAIENLAYHTCMSMDKMELLMYNQVMTKDDMAQFDDFFDNGSIIMTTISQTYDIPLEQIVRDMDEEIARISEFNIK